MEPPRICHEVVVRLNYPRRTGIKSVNGRCGLSQCKTARRFKVHYSTISCSLRRWTSIVIRKHLKAPKTDSEQQQVRVQKNCGKLYRKLLSGCDLIMNEKKYFKLTGNKVVRNLYFYSTDPTTTPKVKFQCKTKFEPKIMIKIVMSSKDSSNIYVHKSKQAVNQGTYLKEYIDKRLLPNIIRMEIICFGQSTLFKYCLRKFD